LKPRLKDFLEAGSSGGLELLAAGGWDLAMSLLVKGVKKG